MAKQLEKIQKDFHWGSIGDDYKFHMLKWLTICLRLQQGDTAGGSRYSSISEPYLVNVCDAKR